MPTINIPPQGPNGPSTPVGDTITVAATRVRNTPRPLTDRNVGSFAGNVAGRSWGGTWFVDGLTGSGMGLYSGPPVVYQNPSTQELFVHFQYQHTGTTSEEVTPDVVASNVWEGERGDNMTSPYITAVPTPRSDPTKPTLWTCIDLGGWLFHVTATGRVITNCGRALPDGVFPSIGGARKVLHGTFVNGEFNGPNDLCFDPNIPTIIYVADTFNDRIAKVHETSPGVVSITTYYTGGLLDPYSLYAEPDGTLIVADRGNNRVVRIPQVGGAGGTAGTLAVVGTADAPMVVRPFSDGNICVAEHGGTRRLLEMTRSNGALRQIGLIRTPQGVQTTSWLWMDVDDHGTCGPVDDIFTVLSSSYDTLRRTSRDGTYGVTGTSGFVTTGSHLHQGALSLTQDPQGHYPWAVACSDHEAKILVTGSGSTQIRQFRRIVAGDVTTLTASQKDRTKRGAGYISGLNVDTTRPSFWLSFGKGGGQNFLGAPNKTGEDVDALSWNDFALWARAGGNGSVPRIWTDAELQDIKYYIKMCSRRGLTDSTVDAVGHAAPGGEPPPTPVNIDVVTGLTVDIVTIEDPEPPPPEPPPTPGFVLGANVRVTANPTTTVRSAAGSAATSLGTQPLNAEGIILGSANVLDPSPTFVAWHNINFNTGVDGWVKEADLTVFVPAPPPPPNTGDPGTWALITVPDRTIYQPYLAGSQSIIEGQPGAAVTVAPRPITDDGAVFRSFSGMKSGLGRVWYYGGGHAGHPGNDFDIFTASTRTWQVIPFAAECPPPYNPDGTPNEVWRNIKGGGSGAGGFSPTGRPWCQHTGNMYCIDTLRDRMLCPTPNGLGAFSDTGVWTQLSGSSKAAGDVTISFTQATYFDSTGNGTIYYFAGDTSNAQPRGIYKYVFNADGTVASKGFVASFPAISGWGWGSKYLTAVGGPNRTVYLFAQVSGGTSPAIPNRLFQFDLTTNAMVWDETLVPGTAAYDDLSLSPSYFRAWDRRSATGQLYFYRSASGLDPSGFWIKSEATNSWSFLQSTAGGPAGLARWTFNYVEGQDIFVGLNTRSLYCGVTNAACGGVVDTWIYTP